MTKTVIWFLAIALAFVAGTLVTGTITWAQNEPPPPDLTTDTDGDGVPDIEDSDDDNDGLTDVYEQNESETTPTLADSDGDGTPDGEELVGHGIDPRTGEPKGATDPKNDDSDRDGFTDTFENKHNSDPNDDRVTPVGPGRR